MTTAVRASLLAAVFACLGPPLTVAAQPSDAARYRTLVAEAIAEFDARHWEEARALFLRAHEIKPSARPLRGAGMASYEMRAYVDAWRYLTRALAETRRPLTRAQRREVERLLARAEAFIGRARIRVEPSSATLTIDLRPARPEEDGTFLLDVGSHAVRVTAPGHDPASSRVTIEPTEITDLTIALERAGPRVVRVDRPGDAPIDSGSVLMLGAGGALGVGAVIGIIWIKGRDGAIDRCDSVATSSVEECVNGNTLEVERTVALGATIAFAAGAVTMTALGVLRMLGRSATDADGDDRDSARLDCGLSLSGIACAGRF